MRILQVLVVGVFCAAAVQCIKTDDTQEWGIRCPDACVLRKDEGIDCGERVRWYFDKRNGFCRSFNYKGCHGNKNNFRSKKECFQECLGCRYLLNKPGSGLGQPTCTCKDIENTCRVSIRPPSGYLCHCSHDQNWKCVGKAVRILDSGHKGWGEYPTRQRIPGHTTSKFSERTEMIGQRSRENINAYYALLKAGKTKEYAVRRLSQDMPPICTQSLLPCDPSYPYRMTNGTCNNIQNKLWGSEFTPFRRILPQAYSDGIGEPRGGRFNSTLPNARLVSTSIHNDLILPDPNTTNMVAQVGQFLDHDMTMAPEGDEPCCSGSVRHHDCWAIKIFSNDTFYSGLDQPQTCLAFTRSTPYCFPAKSGVREQMNMPTGFVDGSQIYGPDIERAFQLRQYSKGRLRVNTDNPNLLPTVKQVEQSLHQHIEFMGDFLAGDNRVNEMPALATMHTLMVREHNRIADEIYSRRPSWSDEIIFQESRRLVVAQWQNIIYSVFLPIILGQTSMDKHKISLPTNPEEYTTYDPNVNPTIIHAFASAAYRFGHTLINGVIQLVQGLTRVGMYLVRDNYFESIQITQQTPHGSGYDLILGGLIVENAQTSDEHVTEDLTNYLQLDVSLQHNYGSDLIARNIQRGRDHGIRAYGEYRTLCGLGSLTDSWSDAPKEMRPEVWAKLSNLYKSPLDIDLFTGGLSEFLVPDGLSGPTFNCIKSMQFAALKDGDRFFFTHSNQPRPFTPAQLTTIRRRTLGDIICDNSGIQATAQNVFRPFNDDSNLMLQCSDPTRASLTMVDEIVPPRGIKFVHAATNLCLTVHGANSSDGAVMNLYPCQSPLSDNQRFDIIWADRGQGKDKVAKTIMARHSKKCLEVNRQSQAIDQWTCLPGGNQEWVIVEGEVQGSFRLKSVDYGKCIHVVNTDGVVLQDCKMGAESSHQLFKSFASI